MTRRARILRQLVDTGRIPIPDYRADKNVAVTISKLRKLGFKVTTVFGVCYEMSETERSRLADSSFYRTALADDATHRALFVALPVQTIRVLLAEAEERQTPLTELLAQVVEAGLDAILGD